MRLSLHTFWKVTNCATEGDYMISLWKVYNGTYNLCVLYSRSSGWEFCLSKGIRFSLENNKALFLAGASTLPPKYIRSQTIFRHEGWYFCRKKGHSSVFNRFKVNLLCFVWKDFQWLNENICGLMADPWVACPDLGEKSRCMVWAQWTSARNWMFQSWFCQALPRLWSKGLAGQSGF